MTKSGVFGFRVNGQDKVMRANTSVGLHAKIGMNMLKFVAATRFSELEDVAGKIRLVEPEDIPLPSHVKQCSKWRRKGPYPVAPLTWHKLLTGLEPTLDPYRFGLMFMISAKQFIQDSEACIVGYILDVDEDTLEIYEGLQTELGNGRYNLSFVPKNDATPIRYSKKQYKQFTGCKLVLSIPCPILRAMDASLLGKVSDIIERVAVRNGDSQCGVWAVEELTSMARLTRQSEPLDKRILQNRLDEVDSIFIDLTRLSANDFARVPQVYLDRMGRYLAKYTK